MPCAAGVEGFLADEVHRITGLTGHDLMTGRGGVIVRGMEMERIVDKPVIAINAATWWMALRDNGVDDRLHGFGTLLREY